MRYAPRALLAGGLGLAASILVACGGNSGLLSGGQAGNLNSQLDQIATAVDKGQCGAATSAASAFSDAITNLPGSVNQTLVRNLSQGAQTISQLAARDCQNPTTTSSSTTSSTSTTTSTSTSTSPSTSTSTTTSTSSAPTSSSATTTSGSGTASTTSGSGGAGLGGTGAPGGAGGAGGAGAGNGGGNGQ